MGIWVHNTRACNCNVGDLTSGGRRFTQHGADQAKARGYSADMVDNIVDNWTNQAHQPGGRTVYGQRKSDGYYVVVLDIDNGNNTLSNRNAV